MSMASGRKAKTVLNDTILTDSVYLDLFRELSFLKARTAMAETDSIYLTINLADSGFTLEISGVAVARTKFTRLSSSKIFLDRNSYVISSMLSEPFTITKELCLYPEGASYDKNGPEGYI